MVQAAQADCLQMWADRCCRLRAALHIPLLLEAAEPLRHPLQFAEATEPTARLSFRQSVVVEVVLALRVTLPRRMAQQEDQAAVVAALSVLEQVAQEHQVKAITAAEMGRLMLLLVAVALVQLEVMPFSV